MTRRPASRDAAPEEISRQPDVRCGRRALTIEKAPRASSTPMAMTCGFAGTSLAIQHKAAGQRVIVGVRGANALKTQYVVSGQFALSDRPAHWLNPHALGDGRAQSSFRPPRTAD